jgi:hypothetical protein
MDFETDFVGNDKETYMQVNNEQVKKCPPEDGLTKGQNM